MDSETKAALEQVLDALEVTNKAINGLRAHALKTDPSGSDAVRREIREASSMLDAVRRSLQSPPAQE
jgi:hypothetical protein